MQQDDENQMILRELADLGMNPELIQQVSKMLYNQHWELGKRILKSYRSTILTELHKAQKHLYSLDYLIHEIESKK